MRVSVGQHCFEMISETAWFVTNCFRSSTNIEESAYSQITLVSDNGFMSRLSESEIEALNEALDDEHKAWATYDQVIEDFGPVRPFINIRESESRHINALANIYDRYGLTVPANPWVNDVPHYDNLHAACEAAVQAEIENVEIYKRIMQASERADILTVFRNLRDASQQRHLPAFRRCLSRGQRRGARDCR